MKKVLHVISLILQYAVTAFLAFMTLGGFITAFPAGIVFLISTLLACPFTRNKGYEFIQKIFKIPMKTIKGWIIIPIFILFCVGVSLIPTSENNTNNHRHFVTMLINLLTRHFAMHHDIYSKYLSILVLQNISPCN